MVAGGLERTRQALKRWPAVVVDRRRLAVHGLAPHDAAAERLPDALVAQTDAQDGHLARELPDGGERYPGVRGAPGPGGDHESVVPNQVRDFDLVVPVYGRLRAQLGQQLDQVPGERIVVVDHRDAAHRIASAISTALNMAPAFSSVSSYSRSGRESATTPAPAWT